MSEVMTYKEGEMETAISAIKTTFSNYQSYLQEMNNQVRQSLSNWEASPRELYEQKNAEWNREADDRRAKLEALPGQLNQIAATYTDTTAKVSRTWS